MKKISILAILVIMASSCSDNASTTSGNVALKATAISTSGTSLTARTTGTSTVVITDFKINIGDIKFETDMMDSMHSTDPEHSDVKLNGPFLLDLLDANKPLSAFITSVNMPNAKYDEIKIKFVKSTVLGEMNGKSYLIKGTVDGKEFSIWSTQDVVLHMDFMDPSKNITVNNSNVSLDIKIQLDAIMANIASLANQGLLIDVDGNGRIDISTDNEDGHHNMGEQFRNLLEGGMHLDDKD